MLTPDQRRLLDALVDQGALAIERVLLVEDMDRVKRTVESERLRSALLTSISHDLKTPLASVLGAASTMRDLAGNLSDAEKRDLLATVIDESERLNRFIANLLDMTKLESGAIVPNTALHDVGEIVGSALRRAEQDPGTATRSRWNLPPTCRCWSLMPCCSSRCCSICSTMPPNIRRPTPRSRSGAFASRDAVMLQVADEGERHSADELESVFDKFYRVQKGDHVRPGTGLGLAISRGFVEAMHGRSRPPTAPTAAARCSPSACRCRRAPDAWIPPHERRPDQGAWSSTTSRRSANCCAWG